MFHVRREQGVAWSTGVSVSMGLARTGRSVSTHAQRYTHTHIHTFNHILFRYADLLARAAHDR